MDVLIFLIPVALSLGLIGLAAFFWTLNNDQYEDLEGAANRILIDDERSTSSHTIESANPPLVYFIF